MDEADFREAELELVSGQQGDLLEYWQKLVKFLATLNEEDHSEHPHHAESE